VQLNNELRANKTDPALIQKAVKELDSAIEKAPKFPNKESLAIYLLSRQCCDN